jgi:hypothetical protein
MALSIQRGYLKKLRVPILDPMEWLILVGFETALDTVYRS